MEPVIGIALVFLVLAVLAWGIRVLAGDDPPAEPPARALEDENDRDLLFRPPAWKKDQQRAVGAPALPTYNRPLDPAPENELLPPPRDIRGVNGGE